MTEYVLPLVLHLEKTDPPTHTDALEAAAAAVLLMLAADDPEWQQAIEAWEGHHIRKVVRRARRVHWRRAAELPGLTAERGTAEVRAYPPIPLDAWPPELAKLQVGGTELEDPDPLPPVAPGTPLVLLSPLARMSTGKAMAQVGHAAHLGWRDLPPDAQRRWVDAGFPIAVREATPAQWARARREGVLVRDGGYTEVAPGTETAAFVVA